jgi:phage baseplate assembly protein W
MALTAVQEQLIGKGIVFPFILEEQGRIEIKGGIPLIRASLTNILSWPYADRYFLKEFGSRLYELIDEPNDDVLKSLVRQFIIDSIEIWEKRIKLTGVNMERTNPQTLNVQISYRVIATQQEDSFIFPFYTEIQY